MQYRTGLRRYNCTVRPAGVFRAVLPKNGAGTALMLYQNLSREKE